MLGLCITLQLEHGHPLQPELGRREEESSRAGGQQWQQQQRQRRAHSPFADCVEERAREGERAVVARPASATPLEQQP